MAERLLRLYLDTSVYGGCFDPEFEVASRRLFGYLQTGKILILVSELVATELALAPERVQALADSLPESRIIRVPATPDADILRDAYLEAGIVTEKSIYDATHVAIATVAQADAIVSWNFKHIVQLQRIAAYNEVNEAHGYPALSIVSPMEVRFDD